MPEPAEQAVEKEVEKSLYPWDVGSATSFEQAIQAAKAREVSYEMARLIDVWPTIVGNIMADDEITNKSQAMMNLTGELTALMEEKMNSKEADELSLSDKARNFLNDFLNKETKREGGVDYPSSDYAYVPDASKPSTWKLRLSQGRPGNITKSQLGRAAAAFSSGGFRGNKVQLSGDAVSKAKARIRREYRKLGVKAEDMPESIRKEKDEPLHVWYNKERDEWRFFVIYSNNFRDQDNPPEIISDASHRNFVKAVDDGELPYPELWLWHVKGSRVGMCDWLDYTDEGFALASGYFEMPEVAKGLKEYKGKLLVSHGMPPQTIERNDLDKSVITKHVTREISVLPADAAANKLTSFEILGKELNMPIQESKKSFLEEVGLSEDAIARIEGTVATKAEQAKEEDLESKQVDEMEEEEEEETAEPKEVAVTPEEIVKAISAFVMPLVERTERLEKAIADLTKTDAEKIAEKAANMPQASFEELVAQSTEQLFSKQNQVDGRSALAKSGPKETAPKEPSKLFFQDWLQ